MEYTTITHQFEPVYDEHSRILILGTLPSVKSRANHFYYGHPQNRFWRLLAALYGEEVPVTIADKTAFLKRCRVAVWDVICQCDIAGSSDSSIRNVIPNDIGRLLAAAPIEQIYANGTKAYDLYNKYCRPQTGRGIIKLPSTSPANAAYSLVRLTEEWQQIKPG